MKATKCRRCGGSDQKRLAGYMNHLNGETHCYGCDGTGIGISYTAEEKARFAANAQWRSDAHFKLVGGFHSYENQIRRTVRDLTGGYGEGSDPEARRALELRLTFWVGDAMLALGAEEHEERQAAEREARRAFAAARDAA